MSTSAERITNDTPLRVLIVDDLYDVRLLLRTWLDLAPDLVWVGEASNGVEAVHLGRALQPDAVVLDLEMPVMCGDEAIPLLRAAVPGIHVIIHSAAPRSATLRLAGPDGPDAVVAKGEGLRGLGAHLRALFDQRSAGGIAGSLSQDEPSLRPASPDA